MLTRHLRVRKMFRATLVLIGLLALSLEAFSQDTRKVYQASHYKLIGVIHSVAGPDAQQGSKSGLAIIKNLKSGRTYYLRLGDPMLSDQLKLTKIGTNFVELTDMGDAGSQLLVRFDGSQPSTTAARQDSASISAISLDNLRQQAEEYLDNRDAIEQQRLDTDEYIEPTVEGERDEAWPPEPEDLDRDEPSELGDADTADIRFYCADGQVDCDPRE